MIAKTPEDAPQPYAPSDNEDASATARTALTGQQSALLRALRERNRRLETMYLGAMCILADAANPDRFALCAHNLRELMEKLPESLDVSTKAQQESLKSRVVGLESDFVNLKHNPDYYGPESGWKGTVNGQLRKFLSRIDGFFDWFSTNHPRRRDEVHAALVRIDVSGRALPKPLISLNIDAWERIRDYFVTISHHGRIADELEFRQWSNALEGFLLDRMVPRTFDDFTAIDKIVEQEVGNA